MFRDRKTSHKPDIRLGSQGCVISLENVAKTIRTIVPDLRSVVLIPVMSDIKSFVVENGLETRITDFFEYCQSCSRAAAIFFVETVSELYSRDREKK